MIRATDIHFDLAAMRTVLQSVEPLFDRHNQIGVTSRPGAAEPLRDAVGWLPEDVTEADYSVINEEFRGTHIEKFLQSLPFQWGRTRLMRLPAKSCLSIHADPSRRYHYAIITNPDAYIVAVHDNTGTFHHIPADGYLYQMDAHKTHTAINAGKEDRFHLVLCNAEPEDLSDADPVGRVSLAPR